MLDSLEAELYCPHRIAQFARNASIEYCSISCKEVSMSELSNTSDVRGSITRPLFYLRLKGKNQNITHSWRER